LRFLRKAKLSFWHTYSKPASKSVLISSGFSATLTLNSSLENSNVVRSMLMCISALSRDLWPGKVLTYGVHPRCRRLKHEGIVYWSVWPKCVAAMHKSNMLTMSLPSMASSQRGLANKPVLRAPLSVVNGHNVEVEHVDYSVFVDVAVCYLRWFVGLGFAVVYGN